MGSPVLDSPPAMATLTLEQALPEQVSPQPQVMVRMSLPIAVKAAVPTTRVRATTRPACHVAACLTWNSHLEASPARTTVSRRLAFRTTPRSALGETSPLLSTVSTASGEGLPQTLARELERTWASPRPRAADIATLTMGQVTPGPRSCINVSIADKTMTSAGTLSKM